MGEHSSGLAFPVEMNNNRHVSAFEELRDRIVHIGDLTCQHAVELVTEYLEGALTPRARKRFERHIRGCAACTTYLDQVRLTADTLGRVHPDPPTGPARDSLLQAFRDFSRD
jgi:hypothetical protein